MKQSAISKTNALIIGVFLLQIGLLSLRIPGISNAANAQTPQPSREAPLSDALPNGSPQLNLEQNAIDRFKAMSNRLASAQTLAFTAISSYESPSRLGVPLVYTTVSEVTLQRPDKLRVITSGQGAASEFYYDGKTMTAYAPDKNLVAVAEAPATIDAALASAYSAAAIYFPFTDMITADPYGDIASSLKVAFYIGQSQAADGTTTDMIAIANDKVFAQIWIGADDLPRMMRVVYADDPLWLRHQVEFTNWQLNSAIAPDTFSTDRTNSATRIPFTRPDPP